MRLSFIILWSLCPFFLLSWTQERVNGDSGAGLHWCTSRVNIWLNEDGSSKISGGKDLDALRTAMDVWNSVECNHPELVEVGLTQDRDKHGKGTPARNFIVWRTRDEWEQAGYSFSALAMTTLWYDPGSGRVYKGTMEFNDTQNWSVGTPVTGTDVWNTASHEFGHFIGMDHSKDPNATMYPYTGGHDMVKRDLNNDDINGICSIYSKPYKDCSDNGCGCTNGSGSISMGMVALLLLILLVFVLRSKAGEY
ncbi:MAG: matrixin family metalloprotease [Deltaproteobacteria bacterium]|nr:matrixin family metalloprotease [Deltaproteobacteria bacterium]